MRYFSFSLLYFWGVGIISQQFFYKDSHPPPLPRQFKNNPHNFLKVKTRSFIFSPTKDFCSVHKCNFRSFGVLAGQFGSRSTTHGQNNLVNGIRDVCMPLCTRICVPECMSKLDLIWSLNFSFGFEREDCFEK